MTTSDHTELMTASDLHLVSLVTVAFIHLYTKLTKYQNCFSFYAIENLNSVWSLVTHIHVSAVKFARERSYIPETTTAVQHLQSLPRPRGI